MGKISWSQEELKDRNRSTSGVSAGIDSGNSISQGYHHGSLTRGLIAYYPMEKGEGQVLHDGALNKLGQINGASWASGHIGNNALSFDGTDDYVDTKETILGNHASGSFTVSAWVNFDNFSSGNYVVAEAGGSHHNRFAMGHNGTNFIFYFEQDDSNFKSIEVSDSSYSTGSWILLTAVWKKEGNAYFYLNDTKEGSVTHDGTLEPTSVTTKIGARGGGENLSLTDFLKGKMGDVRIYDRALSRPELQALYNSGNGVQNGTKVTENDIPSQNQNGVSRYKFNGDVTDSWNNNDGTDNTSTGYGTGVYGQAKKFDGTDDYVSLPAFNQFSAYTVTGWFKFNSINDGDNDHTVAIRENQEIVIRENGSGSYKFAHYDGSSYRNIGTTAKSGWNHIATSWDGSTQYLYVNGSIVASQSVSSTGSESSKGDHLGATSGSNYFFDGSADDIRIYSRALKPHEVFQLYQHGTRGKDLRKQTVNQRG